MGLPTTYLIVHVRRQPTVMCSSLLYKCNPKIALIDSAIIGPHVTLVITCEKTLQYSSHCNTFFFSDAAVFLWVSLARGRCIGSCATARTSLCRTVSVELISSLTVPLLQGCMEVSHARAVVSWNGCCVYSTLCAIIQAHTLPLLLDFCALI